MKNRVCGKKCWIPNMEVGGIYGVKERDAQILFGGGT